MLGHDGGKRGLKFLARVKHVYGSHFMQLLLSNYVIVKGMLLSIITNSQLSFYQKDLKLSAAEYQTYQVIGLAPWATKGFLGSISDAFPLGGYRKRWYLMSTALMGTVATVLIAITPFNFHLVFKSFAPILFFFINLQVASGDLLCAGKYAELMAKNPKSKSDIVSFVWLCISLGQLLAACITGPIADNYGARTLFMICIPLSVQAIVPVALGWMPEQPVEPALRNRLDVAKIKSEYPTFTLACVMASCALIVAIGGLFLNTTVQICLTLVLSGVCCVLGFKCLHPVQAKCNLYIFLQESACIGLGGAMDFWFTAGEDCVPGGPAFSYTYYQMYTQLVGTVAQACGIIIFQKFFSGLKLRTIFWTTTLVRILASGFDIILVERINLTHFGISDRKFFFLGEAIIMPICSALNWMPMVTLTSKLCPPNMECTMYAILAGFCNFGVNVGKFAGVYLMDVVGVDTVVSELP
eukprot:Lankesteria_metandrocarpae@DN5416_c0_g1_i4.p1